MKKGYSKIAVGVFGSFVVLIAALPTTLFAAPPEAPVKGMVTMVDLGAKACIPCKMMAPILEKLEKEYAGRAAVIFFDVWKDDAPARRFGIRTIPTQIFFDKKGQGGLPARRVSERGGDCPPVQGYGGEIEGARC